MGSSFSMDAADYAISIACKNNSQLIALYVLFCELKYAYSCHILGFVTPTTMNSNIEDARTKANQWFEILENIISKKDSSGKYLLKTDFLVTDTSIIHALLNYAENHGIKPTVVGTQGRLGLKKMVLGSIASAVATYSLSVLVIK